jgi:hypothetical protein
LARRVVVEAALRGAGDIVVGARCIEIAVVRARGGEVAVHTLNRLM